MKLYIAISGKSEDEILKSLKQAIENDAEFTEDNCFVENNAGGVNDYQIDYCWSDEDGIAYLADLSLSS